MTTKAWKEDRTIKGVSGYDSPIPPSVQEQAEDKQYGDDFALLVVLYRERMRHACVKTHGDLPRVLAEAIRHIATVVVEAELSTDHYLADFLEKWGTPKALRALATALEQGA